MVLHTLRILYYKTLDFEIEKKIHCICCSQMFWVETSLVNQWLRFYALNVGGMGSIPGWKNKILHATQGGQEI